MKAMQNEMNWTHYKLAIDFKSKGILMNDRHNRSNLLLNQYKVSAIDKLREKTVVITGDDKLLSTDNGLVMAKTLVNLTCRFIDKIHIVLPNSRINLQQELEKFAKEIGVEVSNEFPSKIDVVVSIGNSSAMGNLRININSDGWVSHLACNKVVKSFNKPNQNPIGAMGAACFASSEVFKSIFRLREHDEKKISKHPNDFVFSFLTYLFNEDNFDFPANLKINDDILLIGAGAVGSAFIFGLSQIPNIHAKITVIDDDEFDETSTRCLTYFPDKIGKNKAKVAEGYSIDDLEIVSQPVKFENFDNKNSFPIIVSTVDNNDTRYQIQYELPKIIFHGATGNSVSNVSNKIPK